MLFHVCGELIYFCCLEYVLNIPLCYSDRLGMWVSDGMLSVLSLLRVFFKCGVVEFFEDCGSVALLLCEFVCFGEGSGSVL